eukprot:TRINITY_DN4450_c0_g2_i1.p1 TRINITY_DN4450_c0_g2~~TRINITY_DN4450_c0_g2_i1.p1  ORF type:complete len:420 (-),score=163.82 TRINITY_DN4450_c0_g2_i1:188-1447(-)
MSSFVRKSSKTQAAAAAAVGISGTRPSALNGQLLISTGLHELDEILGGGQPVGSVMLVEQDTHSAFYTALLRYFIAEGVAVDHAVALASASDPSALIASLPKNLTEAAAIEQQTKLLHIDDDDQGAESSSASPRASSSAERMAIAWQYEKYLHGAGSAAASQHASAASAPSMLRRSGTLTGQSVRAFSQSYDLSRPAPPDALRNKTVHAIDVRQLPCQASQLSVYEQLYQQLSLLLLPTGAPRSTNTSSSSNVLRIALHSVASPLWPLAPHQHALAFMHSLRALVRSSQACCLVTVPSSGLLAEPLRAALRQLADIVVAFDSFDGSGMQASAAFSEFDGQLLVHKLPRMHSLVVPRPPTLNFVFKLKRRKLHIEIPHLGPADIASSSTVPSNEVSVSNKQQQGSGLLCVAPGRTNQLDF